MIYYTNNKNFENCIGFKDYEKVNYNGTRFYYQENSENVIVYYHGNAGSACDRSYFVPIFEHFNVSILFAEYTGYSTHSQKPSKNLILQDVQNIHKFIEENSFNNVIIYGESIGSGPASYHAYLGNVDHLILVSPFSALDEVVQSKYRIYPASILLKEKYDNAQWLQGFKDEVIIIHGEKDMVIPTKFSKKLFEKLSTEKKKYVLIEGKGHNDLYDSDEFKNEIIEIINRAQN